MKVAVASTGSNLNSDIGHLFGRSPNFLIADMENGEIKDIYPIENPSKNEKGAGNMAAQFIVDNEVKILISGELDPIAFVF
jgi:predicted Fe-Mo cluster-binding NifX family protein